MTDLGSSLCSIIEANRERIEAFGDRLYRTAELGFKEFKTAELLARKLKGLGLSVREGLAITGLRADVECGGKGPTVALIAELDALYSPAHEAATARTGAAHTCGHHCESASVYGAALGLLRSKALDKLAGRVVFFGVPAEEYVEIEYRLALKAQGKIEFLGGKQELVKLGEFDDIDLALSIHLGGHARKRRFGSVGGTGNGFVAKTARFIGKPCHAASPEGGVNALDAANLALAAVNAQRAAFPDPQCVRVHPIVTHGGTLVNIIPGEVTLEMLVRAKTTEWIERVSCQVDRALKAGAMALGAQVEINDTMGYMPLVMHRQLAETLLDNMQALLGKKQATLNEGHGAASSDFGDLSQLMPTVQGSMGGGTGEGHTASFRVVDPYMAYVEPAKVLAMTVADLLANGAEKAQAILADHKPCMTKRQYLAFLRKMTTRRRHKF